jgi:hypothetical protein
MHRHRQRGVTFIGWLVLLVPIAIIGYAGIRLAPVYLNYMKVARSLQQVSEAFKGDSAVTADKIRRSIENRFDIESVDFPSHKDIVVRREGPAWVLRANYEETAPLFYNVQLLVTFDKTVEVR